MPGRAFLRFAAFPGVLVLGLAAAGGTAPAAMQTPNDAVAAAMAAKLRDERLVLLHAAEFDPLAGPPAWTLPLDLVAALLWSEAERATPAADYVLVQFSAPIAAADRAAAAALGATLLAYVPNHAFIARADAGARAALSAWSRVRALVPFEPAYRIDPDLLGRAAGSGDAPLAVMIELFAGADVGTATRDLFLAGARFDAASSGARTRVLAQVPADRLTALAHVADVQWIQHWKVPELRRAPVTAALAPLPRPNDTTNWVVQSNINGSTPVWANGVKGDGVIIGHIDGALDLAMCFFDDPAVGTPGPTHRKVVSHHGSSSNSDSHGTHTAGTAAGDQEPINGVLDDNGLAYHARLAHTNLDKVDSSNFKSKLEELHADGATIFTNSWGDDSTTKYDAWCVDIDEMVWENPETVICFAVSNLSTLKNPENAKNVLAVGASEQSPNQGKHCLGGQGPTSDGRRKPEIYAPGCGILSANDNTSCSTTSMSGTSMACPSIAGGAALVKNYYEAGVWPSGTIDAADAFTPSGSLIKATLLNAARDMLGESGYPTNLEGWGRLVLDHTLYFTGDTRQLWLADPGVAGGFAASGESQLHWIHVLSNVWELNLTLVFPDFPGTVNSSAPVVNDLDLEVLAPDGSVFKGNVFSNEYSATGGSTDPLNNVERVRIAVPVPGWYQVTVNARTVTTATRQPYALVASADLEPPFDGGFATYGSGTAGTGGFVPAIALSGSPGFGDDVTLTISNGRGSAPGLLLLGYARGSLPFAGGQLLVAAPWTTFPLTLGGTPGVGGAGTLSITDTLPDDPALVGVIVDLQVLLADPAAVKKLALSNGAELTIGS